MDINDLWNEWNRLVRKFPIAKVTVSEVASDSEIEEIDLADSDDDQGGGTAAAGLSSETTSAILTEPTLISTLDNDNCEEIDLADSDNDPDGGAAAVLSSATNSANLTELTLMSTSGNDNCEEIDLADSDDDPDGGAAAGLSSAASVVNLTESDPILISTLVKEHCIFCLKHKSRLIFSFSKSAVETDGHELLSRYFGIETADCLNDIFDAATFANKVLITGEFPAPLLCEDCVKIIHELDELHKNLELIQGQILLKIRQVRKLIFENGTCTDIQNELSVNRLQFEAQMVEKCGNNHKTAEMVISVLNKFQKVIKGEISDQIDIHLEHLEQILPFNVNAVDIAANDMPCSFPLKETASASMQTENGSFEIETQTENVTFGIETQTENVTFEIETQTENGSFSFEIETQTEEVFIETETPSALSSIDLVFAAETMDITIENNDSNDYDDNPATPPAEIEKTMETEGISLLETNPIATVIQIQPTPIVQTPPQQADLLTTQTMVRPSEQDNPGGDNGSLISNTPSIPAPLPPQISQPHEQLAENRISIIRKDPHVIIIERNKSDIQQEAPNKKNLNTGKRKRKSGSDSEESESESGSYSDSGSNSDSEEESTDVEGESSSGSQSMTSDSESEISNEDEKTVSKKILGKVQKSSTRNILKLFKCIHCRISFARRYEVNRHMRNIHQAESDDLQPPAIAFSCTGYDCDFDCEKLSDLRTHMENTHQNELPMLVNRQTYECDVCGFSKDDLRLIEFLDHLREHEGRRKFNECEDCLQKFTTKQMFQLHPCPQTGRLPGTANIKIANSDAFKKGNELKCRICENSDQFHSEKSLQAHFEHCHKESNPFHCTFCERDDVAFLFSNDLKTHMIEAHDAVKYKCRICQKSKEEFKSYSDLHLHICVEHFGGFLTCSHSYCRQKFRSRKEFEQHVAEHLNDRFYECNVCKQHFKEKSGLQQHVLKYHGQEEENLKHLEHETDENDKPIPRVPHSSTVIPHRHVHRFSKNEKTCSICNYKSCTNSLFERHMQNVHGILVEPKFNSRTYVCDICGYTSNSVKVVGFLQHLQKHEKRSSKTYKCEDCMDSFTTRQLYQLHPCPQTGKLPGTSTIHVEGYNKKITKHPCRLCPGSLFGGERNLQKHSITEHKVNAFTCELCGDMVTFQSTNYLKAHLITVHDAVPYKCRLCVPTQTFKKVFDIYMHINMEHLGCYFECKVCKKRFIDKYRLADHEIVHSDESKFICAFCGKNLRSRKTLNKHVAVFHTGCVKKHMCEFCSKEFNEKSNLTKHVRALHAEGKMTNPRKKRTVKSIE